MGLDIATAVIEYAFPCLRESNQLADHLSPVNFELHIPNRTFILELARRSHATYATLLVALILLLRLKHSGDDELPEGRINPVRVMTPPESPSMSASRMTDINSLFMQFKMARRTILSAFIVSTKFVHDQHVSNSAWSRITGLNVAEINNYEMLLLRRLNFNVSVHRTQIKAFLSCMVASRSVGWLEGVKEFVKLCCMRTENGILHKTKRRRR